MATAEKLITENIDLWTGAIKRKSGVGRGKGSSKKIELYGVKKLRELILEMAVRGLLVPQDASDEPASVLLERIAAEKAELVKEGKIKKQKALGEIQDTEKPFDLPLGWEWAYLGDLSSNIHYGYTASAQPENKGVRLVRITDIQNDKVNWETVPGCEISKEKSIDYLLEDDDVLIARTGGTIGKSYLVENIDVQAVFASYLIRVKRISAMYSPYIKTYLGSSVYWRQLYENASGTGQPNVNATALKQLLVPIPMIGEQHRIVAKVDELMALCDQLEQQTEANISTHQTLVETLLQAITRSDSSANSAESIELLFANFDSLFTTEESVDQLKQTILQLAVMGKLVPQDPSDEPASVLLEKIAAEKEKLVKEKKIKKQKALPPIGDEEKPFELPVGWEWCRLGEIWQDSFYGPRFGKDEYVLDGGYPTIRTTDMTVDGYIELKDPPRILVKEEKLELYSLVKGDILVTRSGSIGTMALFDLEEISIPSAYLIRIRLCKPIYPKYVLLLLMSSLGKGYLGLNTTAVGVPNVNASKMATFVFPVPSVQSQKCIVDKVENLMGLCDQLKDQLNTAQTTQFHLTDVVTEQAIA